MGLRHACRAPPVQSKSAGQAGSLAVVSQCQALELCPLLFDRPLDAAVGQNPIARCRQRKVDLVHTRTLARLGLELERGLKTLMNSRDDAYGAAKASWHRRAQAPRRYCAPAGQFDG